MYVREKSPCINVRSGQVRNHNDDETDQHLDAELLLNLVHGPGIHAEALFQHLVPDAGREQRGRHLLQGELYEVGFVSSAIVLFATKLYAGEAFVFPKGVVHFQLNVGKGDAVALAALSNQNPGMQQVASALFTADSRVEVLEKGFRVHAKIVDKIQKQFSV